MCRLLLLNNGWADCVEIWYAIGSHLTVVHALVAVSMQWSRLGYLCTCARAHRASVSQERFGRLCSNLVCGSGVINYVLSTSHWLGSSARAHVHTPSPYLRSRLTDCATISFVARGPIVTKVTTMSIENHSLIHSYLLYNNDLARALTYFPLRNVSSSTRATQAGLTAGHMLWDRGQQAYQTMRDLTRFAHFKTEAVM